MDIFLIIIGIVLLILGIIGSFVPVLPGPPLSYISLILLQLTSRHPFFSSFLVIWAIITAVIVVLDYVIPGSVPWSADRGVAGGKAAG